MEAVYPIICFVAFLLIAAVIEMAIEASHAATKDEYKSGRYEDQ